MATPQNLHIGQMIKAVFDESGMSISEFARRIHLKRTTVYSIFERSTVDDSIGENLQSAEAQLPFRC